MVAYSTSSYFYYSVAIGGGLCRFWTDRGFSGLALSTIRVNDLVAQMDGRALGPMVLQATETTSFRFRSFACRKFRPCTQLDLGERREYVLC